MRFHLRGLLLLAVFAALLIAAVDVRIGVAALVAGTIIDALSFMLPLGAGFTRTRQRPRNNRSVSP